MGKSRSLLLVAAPLVYILTVLLFVGYRHTYLPAPKLDKDTPAREFSEERAYRHLDALVSMGVRTVGSYENEILAADYILAEIAKIQKEAAAHKWQLEVDVQHPSGSFGLDMISPFVNVYENITNILVRISQTAEARHDALLLSSHFDTSFGTPGASDDATMIANMMEILRCLVHTTDESYPYAVIFNFNGGEESYLQAAHGFITQHEWKDTVRAVVNLESAGSGGRELLFQTGPRNAWISDVYRRAAVYPNGNAIAQDIFQSGVIPSDTDFRIYRDFGDVPGLDFAYVTNGFIYHTPLDNLDFFDEGSMQHTGENILSIARTLLKSPYLNPKYDVGGSARTDKSVFFDFHGLFMMSMPSSQFFYVNWLVIGACLMVFRKKLLTKANFGALLFELQTIVFSVVASVLVAQFFIVVDRRMTWFSQPLLAVATFGGASLFAKVLAHVVRHWRSVKTEFDAEMLEERTFYGNASFWLVLHVVSALFGLGLAGLTVIIEISMFSSRYVYEQVRILPNTKDRTPSALPLGSDGRYLLFLMASTAVPLSYLFFLFGLLLEFFVPVMGRTGTIAPPDLILGALLSVVLSMTVGPLMGIIHRSRHLRDLFPKALAVFVLAMTVASCVNPPYSSTRPKRLFLQHTVRRFPNGTTDSGVWINPLDGLAMKPLLDLELPSLRDARATVCEGISCDFPWYLPMSRIVLGGWYAPAPRPDFPGSLSLELVSSTPSSDGSRRNLSFVATGPDHMVLYFNDTVLDWPFLDHVPDASTSHGEHFVFFASAGDREAIEKSRQPDVQWHFWVETYTDVPLHMNIAGHFLTTPDTNAISGILDELPNWVQPVTWLCLFEKHVF